MFGGEVLQWPKQRWLERYSEASPPFLSLQSFTIISLAHNLTRRHQQPIIRIQQDKTSRSETNPKFTSLGHKSADPVRRHHRRRRLHRLETTGVAFRHRRYHQILQTEWKTKKVQRPKQIGSGIGKPETIESPTATPSQTWDHRHRSCCFSSVCPSSSRTRAQG